ncbi:MAG TPA: phosphatase PAP2 family protein [Actinomycetota bacterium]|nr:phosphatase PAP2 family protein [Actinomycetota bacterium]
MPGVYLGSLSGNESKFMNAYLPQFVRHRLDPTSRYGLRLTLFLVAVTLVAIPFSYLLIEVTSDDDVVEFDLAMAERAFEVKQQVPWVTKVFNAISMLGAPVWFWVLVGGVSIYLWKRHRRRLVAFLLASTVGGSILNTAVKIAVNRPRPTYADPAAITFQEGRSFPSGHAMSSTIAYGALLLIFLPLIRRKYRPWALAGYVALEALIGLSRLGLGVHYISDVAGGYLLGLAWLTASTAAFSIWRVERGRLPVEPMFGVEPEARRDLKPT